MFVAPVSAVPRQRKNQDVKEEMLIKENVARPELRVMKVKEIVKMISNVVEVWFVEITIGKQFGDIFHPKDDCCERPKNSSAELEAPYDPFRNSIYPTYFRPIGEENEF